MSDTRHIYAAYDLEGRVWWAESNDLLGLVSEAPTLEELMERVMAIARELLTASGATADGVDLEFVTTRQAQVA